MRWTAASASLPAISISPMWLTSNSPARVRTAMCSETMPPPAYSTGMSQPPKGTIRAPELRWRALSGVLRRGAAVACSIGEVLCELKQPTVLCGFAVVKDGPHAQGGAKPRAFLPLPDQPHVEIRVRAACGHGDHARQERVADVRAEGGERPFSGLRDVEPVEAAHFARLDGGEAQVLERTHCRQSARGRIKQP